MTTHVDAYGVTPQGAAYRLHGDPGMADETRSAIAQMVDLLNSLPRWDGQICKVCGQNDHTHYVAPDALWQMVVPTGKNVVCLGCFDALATAKGITYADQITDVGFVGRRCNFAMVPSSRATSPASESPAGEGGAEGVRS